MMAVAAAPAAALASAASGSSSASFPAFLASYVASCLHCYLHARALYPAQVFERCRFHSRAVYVARHPAIVSYITNITQAFLMLIQSRLSAPHKLVLVLYDSATSKCLERLVIDVRARVALTSLSLDSKATESMVDTMSKFSFLDNVFVRPMAAGDASTVTWRALLYSNDRAPSAEWCSIDRPSSMIEGSSPLIFPLKSVRVPNLEMEVYVETIRTH